MIKAFSKRIYRKMPPSMKVGQHPKQIQTKTPMKAGWHLKQINYKNKLKLSSKSKNTNSVRRCLGESKAALDVNVSTKLLKFPAT